ncbi:hypothetical protein NKH18_25090 [Streptomyces sp. M10(2022)]
MFLATSAPVYGVLGTMYGLVDGRVEVVAKPREPLPTGTRTSLRSLAHSSSAAWPGSASSP